MASTRTLVASVASSPDFVAGCSVFVSSGFLGRSPVITISVTSCLSCGNTFVACSTASVVIDFAVGSIDLTNLSSSSMGALDGKRFAIILTLLMISSCVFVANDSP
jgi:hypothetical protein